MILSQWEYGALNIYNPEIKGTLRYFFEFIIKHHKELPGDIVECGVYQGRSLLGTACLLQSLKSRKLIYGFDTFAGFPRVGSQDRADNFRRLFRQQRISRIHYLRHLKFLRLRKQVFGGPLGASHLSTSGNFGATSQRLIEKKIRFLGLNNVRLVTGDFAKTMTLQRQPSRIMAALVDCDLYESYRLCLPFIWQRLVPGGYVFLDEYYSLKFPGGRLAVDEFFMDKKEKPRQHPDDGSGFERWYVRKR
jgi:hypothetical protein